MKNEMITQSKIRIQEYLEKIHSIKKHADEALISLIDFLQKSHDLRKDIVDIFMSTAEDVKDELHITTQIQKLFTESSETATVEEGDEIDNLILSLKEFSFTINLKKSAIDSELADKIENAAKDMDQAFHEEIDPILELIAEEQRKIETVQK